MMMLKHNYYYFPKAIPIQTCKKILTKGRQKIVEEATTGGGIKNKAKRNCKVAWISDKWIYNIINPFIHTANREANWNFQWDWNEPSQFTIYKKGHFYGWHTDQIVHSSKHKSKNINGKTRKLSLTLQLTDKTKYEGGDLQFGWIDVRKKNLLNIVTVNEAKEIGTIIVFPSFINHQVTPITKGKRESLVNWSIGSSFQ